MFKHLDLLQTGQVKDAMFLVEHEPGDVVIREGMYARDFIRLPIRNERNGFVKRTFSIIGDGAAEYYRLVG